MRDALFQWEPHFGEFFEGELILEIIRLLAKTLSVGRTSQLVHIQSWDKTAELHYHSALVSCRATYVAWIQTKEQMAQGTLSWLFHDASFPIEKIVAIEFLSF